MSLNADASPSFEHDTQGLDTSFSKCLANELPRQHAYEAGGCGGAAGRGGGERGPHGAVGGGVVTAPAAISVKTNDVPASFARDAPTRHTSHDGHSPNYTSGALLVLIFAMKDVSLRAHNQPSSGFVALLTITMHFSW